MADAQVLRQAASAESGPASISAALLSTRTLLSSCLLDQQASVAWPAACLAECVPAAAACVRDLLLSGWAESLSSTEVEVSPGVQRLASSPTSADGLMPCRDTKLCDFLGHEAVIATRR